MRIFLSLCMGLLAALNAEASYSNFLSAMGRFQSNSVDGFGGNLSYAVGFALVSALFLYAIYLCITKRRITLLRPAIAIVASTPYVVLRIVEAANDYGYHSTAPLEGIGFIAFGVPAVCGQTLIFFVLCAYATARHSPQIFNRG